MFVTFLLLQTPSGKGQLTFQLQPIHLFAAKPQLPAWILGSPKELIEQGLLSRPRRLLGWQGYGYGARGIAATFLTTGVLPALGPLTEKEALSTLGWFLGARVPFYTRRETESMILESQVLDAGSTSLGTK